jgi:hypothetical protein
MDTWASWTHLSPAAAARTFSFHVIEEDDMDPRERKHQELMAAQELASRYAHQEYLNGADRMTVLGEHHDCQQHGPHANAYEWEIRDGHLSGNHREYDPFDR